MLCGRCEHITVKFQQRDLEVTSDWDTLTPGSTAEYAWDEPMAAHRLRVVLESATEAFRDAPVQEYNLDDIKAHPKVRLGRAHSKMVQRVANVGRVIKDMSGMGNRTQSMLHVDQPELDARFVYVGVHADGPTRVLCFSETKDQYTRGSNEESMSLLTSKLARLQERIKVSKQQLLHTPPVCMCVVMPGMPVPLASIMMTAQRPHLSLQPHLSCLQLTDQEASNALQLLECQLGPKLLDACISCQACAS